MMRSPQYQRPEGPPKQHGPGTTASCDGVHNRTELDSYGLFHAIAQPVYSWGVIRKVTFPGVNMDIGHIRNLSWSKDNDRNTWIGYNKLRGQYMSALEHGIPERFFNDPNKCNSQGATTASALLPDCPQGISAMKALGLAAAQGQKIYTITQQVYQANPNIVNTSLFAHSASTRQAVQNTLDVGHEVTIHEKPIAQSGWTGAGYTTIDPETGGGGYMIDGGSNGMQLNEDDVSFVITVFMNTLTTVGNVLQSILANFLGILLTALDAFDIFDNCSGGEALIRSAAFFYMAMSLTLLVGFGVSGFPLFFVVLAYVLLTLILIAMKDAMIRSCEK